jgi:EAL domain-containing protein (putative c-di-GMP-specific phosphodiesterase class I)
MRWCLESVADADREWLVYVEPVPFAIGRADDCNLKLTDRRISKHHCEMRISGDLLWIRDLESTNGTFVNQDRIEQAQLLEPNDTISIGKYKFNVKSISSSTSVTEHDDTICATLSEDLKDFDLSRFEPKLRMLLHMRSVNPHFQPIIRFSDMIEVGYEVLGRIVDEGLPSNPAELLDMAECLGCASELSSLFREVGVEMGKDLPGTPLLFVNSTRFEIHDMDTLLGSMQRIRDVAPSSNIVLEINEKAATDTNELPQLRDALQKMDIGLAFDDFGVGQTRLVELSNTPPDFLKFDISLIRKIHLAPKRLHQMISTFIKASNDLGILTLAEGIECSEESKVCQQLGFDLGQGYHFGRPAPISASAV